MRTIPTSALHAVLTALFLTAVSGVAMAEVVVAEPIAPIVVAYPESGGGREVQIVLQVVVDASGRVESVVVASSAPADAPEVFAESAIEAVKRATFRAS